MKRLHEKVNVIPLIAKADTLTPEECQQFKKQVSGFHSCKVLQNNYVRGSFIYLFILNSLVVIGMTDAEW